MAWVTCPHCGFTQIPAVECLKCRKRLDKLPSAMPAPPGPPRPALSAVSKLPAIPRQWLIALGAAALLVVAAVIFLSSRSPVEAERVVRIAASTPEPWALDLTGRWQGKAATTIATQPPRPALREAFIETDRAGHIVAAGVTLTDPGRGGAGAGYLTVPDGEHRLRDISDALAASPHAALPLDFIPLAPWVPKRDRLWRAIEGQHKNPAETTYLLLESLENDYLIQAGLNASGFLSYLYLSPAYASGRGSDVLSKVIHPSPDASLRGFRNVVWDLSGAADFVSLQVGATIAQPSGTADRIVLKRQ